MPAKGTTMSAEQRELRRRVNLERSAARTHKRCPRCTQELPIVAFAPADPTRRLRPYCGPCLRTKEADWRRSQDPAKRRAIQRRTDLRLRFGITVDDYDRLLAKQDRRCAICRTDTPGARRRYFAVDHDHTTGEVRGLLCVACNSGIGHLGDDPKRLRAGAAYLEQHLTKARSD